MSVIHTVKGKSPRRPPVDRWFVEIMLKANGYKCGCCGKDLELKNCERGHVDKRKPDGSNDTPDNLFPICRSCNKKHTRDQMCPHDHLVPDYRVRVAVLDLVQHAVQIPCVRGSDHLHMVLTTEVTEDTCFIDVQNSKNAIQNEVCLWSQTHGMSREEAEALLDELIRQAAASSMPGPTKKTKGDLISDVMAVSKEDFKLACNRVLDLEPWKLADTRIDLGFWQRFDLQRYAKEARQLIAKQQAERQREGAAARRQAASKQAVAEPESPEHARLLGRQKQRRMEKAALLGDLSKWLNGKKVPKEIGAKIDELLHKVQQAIDPESPLYMQECRRMVAELVKIELPPAPKRHVLAI